MSTISGDIDEINLHRYFASMISDVMPSPEHCRAARAWLGWSQDDLAKRAKVGLSTIRDFEKGTRKPIDNNMLAINAAFAEYGFMWDYTNGHPVGFRVPASS